MPAVIDPGRIHVDELPGVWSPVQWELSPEERIQEVEAQATASLLATVDVPEAVLRLLLGEVDIERAYDPPNAYDPEEQGDWDPDLITFQFKREARLLKVEREEERLYLEYRMGELGFWALEIKSEAVSLRRI